MNIKEYIKHNPYRVLGVVTNDSSATLMSNNSRMKAYASIGKAITSPFDFDMVFGEKPARHADDLAASMSALSTPEGRLRYGMFWFMNVTPTDARALAALAQGCDPLEARKMWEEGEQNMSSLQNQMMCCLLKDPRSYSKAIELASALYIVYGAEFILAVSNGFEVVKSDKLVTTFFAEIVRACEGDLRWWDGAVKRFGYATYDGLWAEAKAMPMLEELQDALNLAQSTACLTPQDHLDIATRLMNQAEPLLRQLKTMVSTYPKLLSRYSTIADTVGEEVLDREITYWNRTPWNPHMKENAVTLAQFCYRYACSVRFKKRSKKSVNSVLGRKEDARLFPNGKPDKLFLESDRKKRNAGICSILAAITEYKV